MLWRSASAPSAFLFYFFYSAALDGTKRFGAAGAAGGPPAFPQHTTRLLTQKKKKERMCHRGLRFGFLSSSFSLLAHLFAHRSAHTTNLQKPPPDHATNYLNKSWGALVPCKPRGHKQRRFRGAQAMPSKLVDFIYTETTIGTALKINPQCTQPSDICVRKCGVE